MKIKESDSLIQLKAETFTLFVDNELSCAPGCFTLFK